MMCAWLLSASSFAQTGGVITGTVRDETGGVLPGVMIDLQSGSQDLTIVTDEVGQYRFEGLPPGMATITFKLINFTVVRREVIVSAGQTHTADAVLGLSLSADVVVTGTRTFRNVADLENPAENLVGIATAASQAALPPSSCRGGRSCGRPRY